MYENIKIEKLDHFGRGITHLDNIVTFVDNALPNELVDLLITLEKKKYKEAKITKLKKASSKRIQPICPYFLECGGCNLMHLSYEDTLNFKLEKAQELLEKAQLQISNAVNLIPNPKNLGYRNKVSLKIKDGKIGYYADSTHNLIEINKCDIANPAINEVIASFKLLNIENGNLTIRCNSNSEILLIIDCPNPNKKIELEKLKEKIKLIGIVYNNKTIYGNNFFYERLGGFLFKVSYNSFFQVNPYITTKLFELVNDNIEEDSTVLDLYSGVGTLSIVASQKASEVISVEIIKNAVVNGIFNAKLNKRDNIKFMLGDVSNVITKLNKRFDTIILDPPRKGLNKETLKFINNQEPKKIIYISCDILTLIRDLKVLESNYEIKTFKVLDMFSYSYHVESFVILEKKKLN